MDAVEHGCFDRRVMDHIIEDDLVARFYFLVK